MDETPFAREYEALLQRFGIDYKSIRDAYPEAQTIREFFNYGGLAREICRITRSSIGKGCAGACCSSSYAPKEGHPNFAPMMAELQRLFTASQRNGLVRMEYFTRVYFGQFDRN